MPEPLTIIHTAEDVSSAGKSTSPFGSFEISTKNRPKTATKFVAGTEVYKISKINRMVPLTATTTLKSNSLSVVISARWEITSEFYRNLREKQKKHGVVKRCRYL